MSWRSWFGLAESGEERRTITPGTLYGDTVPFNYDLGAPQGPPMSQARALSLAPVYAAVRTIADPVSTLPIKAYRNLGDTRTRAPMPQLFADMTAHGADELTPWLYQCVTSMALRGNAFGMVITRDGYGYPAQIIWLDPAWVTPDTTPDNPGGWLILGDHYPRDAIVHIPRFKLPGSRLGLSPIAHFAMTINQGLSAQRYSTEWFDSGGFPPGHFKNEQKIINQQESDAIKARLVSAIRTRTPLVYGADWTYSPISVPPEEAQFIETMQMTATQIAAVYGVPPEEIGGVSSSNTYQNVEQKMLNFTTFTLRSWLVILENAFSAILPNRQYVKFNSDALVRADLATRWQVNKLRVEMGAASINEIRAQEDQDPIPGGNKYESAAKAAAAASTPAQPAVSSSSDSAASSDGPPARALQDDSEHDQPGGVTPLRRIHR